MKTKKMLTIAIPTYNRSGELLKTLSKLLKQNGGNFSILVSDDCSVDNTKQVVEKLQKRHPNLFYNKNKINLGYSSNVCRLYELAETKYVWFLCDDDTVSPTAVKKILSSIQKYQPTVAIYNYTWIDPLGRKITAYHGADTIYKKITDLTTYQPLMRLTFLSTLVVRKGPSLAKLKKTGYKKNIFFQITMGLYLLSKRFNLLESSSVILHRNVGYNYGEFFKSYMTDHLDAVFAIKHNFQNSKFVGWSINQLPTTLSVYLSQKIGLFTYNGLPSKKTIARIKRYYGPYSRVILLFPAIKTLTPRFLIQFIYKMRLLMLYGVKKEKKILKKNLDRALHDKRSSGFLSNQ